uniref:Mitochondrial carrier protein n=1 Tax=Arcella intermedia TaxID=1963864 RepID=A0A6B2LCV3_9EUKA
MVSGAIAGLVSNSLCHPLDTIKALYQYCNVFTMANIRRHWRAEKLRFFFRGYTAVLVTTVPCTALYYVSYEQSKRFLDARDDDPLKQFSCGVFSQFVASFLFTPRDVIKERLQVQNVEGQMNTKPYSGSLDALKMIYTEEGLRGLYRGYFQTLSLWSIYGGIYLAVYSKSKSITKKVFYFREGHPLPPPYLLTCSVTSAAVAAALTNPLDVLKLHYQVQSNKTNFYLLGKNLVKKFGAGVWFKGVTARMLWISPRTGLSFTVYELTKEMMEPNKVTSYATH